MGYIIGAMLNPSRMTESLEIIERTDEAADEYGHNYGSDMVWLEKKHLNALEDGKVIAMNDGEYTTFLVMDGERND